MKYTIIALDADGQQELPRDFVCEEQAIEWAEENGYEPLRFDSSVHPCSCGEGEVVEITAYVVRDGYLFEYVVRDIQTDEEIASFLEADVDAIPQRVLDMGLVPLTAERGEDGTRIIRAARSADSHSH